MRCATNLFRNCSFSQVLIFLTLCQMAAYTSSVFFSPNTCHTCYVHDDLCFTLFQQSLYSSTIEGEQRRSHMKTFIYSDIRISQRRWRRPQCDRRPFHFTKILSILILPFGIHLPAAQMTSATTEGLLSPLYCYVLRDWKQAMSWLHCNLIRVWWFKVSDKDIQLYGKIDTLNVKSTRTSDGDVCASMYSQSATARRWQTRCWGCLKTRLDSVYLTLAPGWMNYQNWIELDC